MRVLSRCDECRLGSLVVRRRWYWTGQTGWIRSQNEQCRRCYRRIRKIIASIGSGNQHE